MGIFWVKNCFGQLFIRSRQKKELQTTIRKGKII